jgi:hypothetical protein
MALTKSDPNRALAYQCSENKLLANVRQCADTQWADLTTKSQESDR